jgi:methylmalonyl-CoA mutase cobalamin-binding subunit
VPLYIAGYPEADLERLKEIGVAGFLHIRQPLDEVLQQLHTHFGIHEYGPNSKEVKA